VHARAALDVFRRHPGRPGARAFLERVYPSLTAQHDYLAGERDTGGGLAAIVHPWESGLDNSPLWDASLGRLRLRPGQIPTYIRRDLRTVDAAARPTDACYDQYVFLADRYRAVGYDDGNLRAGSPFLVEDPLFNAIYLWSTHALVEIATIIGADPQRHRRAAARIHDGMLERLWDPARACFVARDLVADRPIRQETIGTLMPLLDPALPPAVRDAVVARLRSAHFRAAGPPPRGVTTYDALAGDFDPRRYWRGPIWINTNWLLARALRQHGEHELASAIDASTLGLVARAGFHEYFDPLTGEGLGSDAFSWTAALVLDLLKEEIA
jgi:hypothetical protein